MNLESRQMIFNGIPGLDASRGERISKALWNLWKKIDSLEKIRVAEKTSSEAQTNTTAEDLSLTELQCQMLVLQIKYLTSVVRKNRVNCVNVVASVNHRMPFNTVSPTNFDNVENMCHKETQINASLMCATGEHQPEHDQIFDTRHLISDEAEVGSHGNYRHIPHYHMNFDDLPFIIGSSTTESHSLVANLQNIIGLMKSHNKALCGAKPQVKQVVARARDVINIGESTESDKMREELLQEMAKLKIQHVKLEQMFEKFENKEQGDVHSSDKDAKTETKIKQVNRLYNSNKQRAHSDSALNLHSSNKNTIREGKKSVSGTAAAVQNARINPIVSTSERRKVLQSLKRCKIHLQEEDIRWN